MQVGPLCRRSGARERRSGITIASVGHRAALRACHDRQLPVVAGRNQSMCAATSVCQTQTTRMTSQNSNISPETFYTIEARATAALVECERGREPLLDSGDHQCKLQLISPALAGM